MRKDPKLRCQNGDDLVKALEQGMAKVAKAAWDVRLQVGKPVPLIRLVPGVEEVSAPCARAIEDGNEAAQAARRRRPAAWLAAGAAALVVAMGLVVRGQRWASQSSSEGLAEMPVFDRELPAWVDHDADEADLPLDGQVPGEAYTGAADAATLASELVLQATLITGPLPGQKLAPCDKRNLELKYKGACWRIIYNAGTCDRKDFYEPVVGYCEKWHAIYEPVYAEKKAKKPPSVIEPGASGAPVVEDR